MNEDEVKAKFDEIILESGLFNIYRECKGVYIQPRPTSILKTPRIDRILTPTNRLYSLGYNFGVIGVEIKAEGYKAGTCLNQAFDYMRGIFYLMKDDRYLASVMLDVCFIFPFKQFSGALESLTKQSLVGIGDFHNDGITFQFGNIIFLRIDKNGTHIIKPEIFKFGRKVGSR